ncbi:LptF/LptG family permease [Merismopedia glauca]|uniref:Permease n=1 Tax=Merismopedia glauca CCAP 1448/3 TaxID=1296344 RepID=A0A2T1C6J8_9CYAN|nr:LptF/LptG family permease [Merismopedia glauca]PSB03902.1 permease [Merismopedia glauca CCAP 1448/3]
MTFKAYKSFNYWLPRISVMDRYIAMELIPPFIFGVGSFSSLGVAIGTGFDLVRQVAESGLGLGILFKVLLLRIPQFVAYALPMSTLLGTLMTYSRLSGDSELIALRSVGVSIYRIVVPAVLLSFLVTGTTFLFNEFVVPAANYEATATLDRALIQEQVALKGENIIYPEYGEKKLLNGTKKKYLKRLFYAAEFDGRQMNKLTILDWSKEGLNLIVTSESGQWNIKKNIWDLFNGTSYSIAPDSSYSKIARFERLEAELSRAPLDLVEKERNSDEMNLLQAIDYLKVIESSRDEKKILKIRVRIHEKIAFPFICVVFGLIGSTLGNRPQRTGKATSFGISLLVVVTYYALFIVCRVIGQVGIVPPLLAAWLPNVFGLVAGGWLLFRAAK